MESTLEFKRIEGIDFEETDFKATVAPEPLIKEDKSDKIRLLSAVLRRIGALVLLVSAATFVLQGWLDWDSVTRYYVFLGFTTVIAATGIFCGLRLKEDKGARTLLGVACAIVPAHFLQLGAFLYSCTLATPAVVPPMFFYQAPSLTAALSTLVLAMAIVLPIAYAGFCALARVESKRLFSTYALANAVLLLPVRTGAILGVLALGLFAYLLFCDLKYFAQERAMKNFDGYLVRTMLFTPFVLLLGRSMALYELNAFILAAAFASLTAALLTCARERGKDSALAVICEMLALPSVAAAWEAFSQGLFFGRNAVLGHLLHKPDAVYLIPLVVLPVAAIIVALSLFAVATKRWMRDFGFALAAIAAFSQLFTFGSIAASLLCLVLGICLVILAFAWEIRFWFYVGVLNIAAALFHHLKFALELYSLSPWLTLALTGLFVVLGASYLESHNRAVLSRLLALRTRIGSWS